MRILVTGASGFVGAALVPALEARGHEVRGIGRAELDHDSAFAGQDAVVHLANIAHTSAAAALLREVNVEGTRRVAHRAARQGVRRFVYLSSVKAIAEPDSAYGRAKLAAERALAEVAAQTRLEPVLVQPPLTYGAGVKANFLALMRAIEGGWPLPFASIVNRRSLLYVGNLCDAIGRCIEQPAAAGKTYLVSDGVPVSTPELCRRIAQALGRPVRLFRFPAALLPIRSLTGSLEVDDAAIRRELDWQPPFSMQEGLRATADWYLGR